MTYFEHGMTDNAIGRSGVFECYKVFQENREDDEDAEHLGHRSTSKGEENLARVKTLVDKVHRFSLPMIFVQLGIPKRDVHHLNMTCSVELELFSIYYNEIGTCYTDQADTADIEFYSNL